MSIYTHSHIVHTRIYIIKCIYEYIYALYIIIINAYYFIKEANAAGDTEDNGIQNHYTKMLAIYI